jgi:hypothetical protein
VIENGLPELPDVLGEDDEVPIAYWVGPRFAAVLFRSLGEPLGEDEQRESDGVEVMDEVYCWARIDGTWVELLASAGGGRPMADPMARDPYPEWTAGLGGGWRLGDEHGDVAGREGGVGRRAKFLEVEDSSGRTRRSIDAPLGAVVVCFDPHEDVTIRILAQDGSVMYEGRERAQLF